jgi:hypothetical protein
MSECEEFAERRFRIECSSIKFQRAGEEPLLIGPGHVAQTAEGLIEYLVHVDTETIERIKKLMISQRQKLAGSLASEADYFDVTMIPYSGREWKGSALLPGFRSGFPGQPGMACGAMYEIRGESKLPGPMPSDSAHLFVPSLLDFPANVVTSVKTSRGDREVQSRSSFDTASFRIGNDPVEIYRGEGYTVIGCELEAGAIVSNRHLRIREALEFALAQQTAPCAMRLLSGDTETYILAAHVFSSSPAPQQRPPLRFYPRDRKPDVFSLAECYYKKFKDISTEEGHEVSIGLNALINAASADLQTQALVIPVSAETLVKACFPEIVQMEPEFVAEVKEFKVGLDRTKLSPRLYNKLCSSLDYYIDPARQAGRIKAFIHTSGIAAGVYRSWNDLRNKHAHGEPVSAKDAEEVIRQIQETIYLCYTIVLKFIGYSGPRTNYAALGFPTEEFRS